MQIHHVARAHASNLIPPNKNTLRVGDSPLSNDLLIVYPCSQAICEIISLHGRSLEGIGLSFPPASSISQADTVFCISTRDYDHLLLSGICSEYQSFLDYLKKNDSFYRIRLAQSAAYFVYCYECGLFPASDSLDCFFKELVSTLDAISRRDECQDFLEIQHPSSLLEALKATELKHTDLKSTNKIESISQYQLVSRISSDLRKALCAKSLALEIANTTIDKMTRFLVLVEAQQYL